MNNRGLLSTILLLLIFMTHYLSADWNFTTGGYINDCAFIGEEGWLVEGHGRIRHTANNGINWEFQNSSTEHKLYGVHFLDNNNGWAVGNNGTVIHTINGGKIWEIVEIGSNSTLNTVFFSDMQNGWIGGARGSVYHTTDGGTIWNKIETGASRTIKSIIFQNNKIGYICSMKNMYYTNNGGISWLKQPLEGILIATDASFSPSSPLFMEGFETEQFPPTGWITDGGEDGLWLRAINETYIHSGMGCAWYFPYGESADDAKLISPRLNISPGDTYEFYAKTAFNSSSKIRVLYSTDGENWDQIGNDLSFDGVDMYTHFSVNLNSLTSSEPYYLAINPVCVEKDYFSIDDIKLNSTATQSQKGWVCGYQGMMFHTEDGITWNMQETPELPGNGVLFSVYAINDMHVWAVGINGVVIHTVNGGETWKIKDIDSKGWLQKIYFLNENEGWIIGAGGLVYHTINGGETWIPQFTDSSPGLRGVEFANINNVWAVGNNGAILHSNDSGLNWNRVESNSDKWIWNIDFLNENQGFAASNNGNILLTTNGGEEWNSQNIPDANNCDFYGVEADIANNLWIVGESGIIFHSTNNGIDWNPQLSEVSSDLKNIFFISDKRGWVSGKNGTILFTDDGGKNWQIQSTGVDFTIYDIKFKDALNGWAIGSNLLHTIDGGNTWSEIKVSGAGGYHALSFVGEDEIWASGNYTVYSKDCGETWNIIDLPCNIGVWGIDFNSMGIGVAVANGGSIFRYTTEDPYISINPSIIEINCDSKSASFISFLEKNKPQEDRGIRATIESHNCNEINKPIVMLKNQEVDNLFYDDGTMENKIGLKWRYEIIPSNEETIGFATKFEHNESYLSCVDIYFGDISNGDYRLYIWADNEGKPASGYEALYSKLRMDEPQANSWNHIDLSNLNIPLPPVFWVGVCYNKLATSPEWALGIDENSEDDHTFYNSTGSSASWNSMSNAGYTSPFGIRATVTKEKAYFGVMNVENSGIGTLYVDGTEKEDSWIRSVIPSKYSIKPESSKNILIAVNSRESTTGTYNSSITINSNDPANEKLIVPVKLTIPTTGNINDLLPITTSLSQNYPNPFNPTTTIDFSLANNSKVSLKIYDAKGRIVSELVNSNLKQGFHKVNFNGKNLSSGIYYYKLKVDDNSFVNKMIMMK